MLKEKKREERRNCCGYPLTATAPCPWPAKPQFCPLSSQHPHALGKAGPQDWSKQATGAPCLHASHRMRRGHRTQFCQWGTAEVLQGAPSKGFLCFPLFLPLDITHHCVWGYDGWNSFSHTGTTKSQDWGQMSNSEAGKEETCLSLSLINSKTVLTLAFLFTWDHKDPYYLNYFQLSFVYLLVKVFPLPSCSPKRSPLDL